jgi:hypothetical protein
VASKLRPFETEASFGLDCKLETITYKGLEVSSELAQLVSQRNDDGEIPAIFLATSIAMYCKTRSCSTTKLGKVR